MYVNMEEMLALLWKGSHLSSSPADERQEAKVLLSLLHFIYSMHISVSAIHHDIVAVHNYEMTHWHEKQLKCMYAFRGANMMQRRIHQLRLTTQLALVVLWLLI